MFAMLTDQQGFCRHRQPLFDSSLRNRIQLQRRVAPALRTGLHAHVEGPAVLTDIVLLVGEAA